MYESLPGTWDSGAHCYCGAVMLYKVALWFFVLCCNHASLRNCDQILFLQWESKRQGLFSMQLALLKKFSLEKVLIN